MCFDFLYVTSRYSILDMTVSQDAKSSSWLALELAQPSPDVEFIKRFMP